MLCSSKFTLCESKQQTYCTVGSCRFMPGGVFDLLLARRSCVWADNSSACSRISHQPQLAQTLLFWSVFVRIPSMKQTLLLHISEPVSLLSFPTRCFFQTIFQWSIQERYSFKQCFNLTQAPSLVCLEQHYRSAHSAWPDLTWLPLLPAPVHAHSSHVLLIPCSL